MSASSTMTLGCALRYTAPTPASGVLATKIPKSHNFRRGVSHWRRSEGRTHFLDVAQL